MLDAKIKIIFMIMIKIKYLFLFEIQSNLAGEASSDSINDSKTNSPIKYSENVSGSSQNLEVLSVINRLKQRNDNPKSINHAYNSMPTSAVNSASSTPIKLEKSLATLIQNTKQSQTLFPSDEFRRRRDSHEQYGTDSCSSEDGGRVL